MFKDILTFLKNISFMDYIFFFTVVFLIILVVSLVYFIKINDDVVESKEDNTFKDPDNLKVITAALKKEEPKEPIKFTSYEKEQEEKAIISYDELLSNTGEFKLNYLDEDKEAKETEVNVKKVDLNNLVNITQKSDIPKIDAHVISLEKEEEFLIALKQLLNDIK